MLATVYLPRKTFQAFIFVFHRVVYIDLIKVSLGCSFYDYRDVTEYYYSATYTVSPRSSLSLVSLLPHLNSLNTFLPLERIPMGSISTAKMPQINSDRLWSAIMSTSSTGAHPKIEGGMQRLSLSDSDAEIRQYFISQARDLGCEVKVDESGNMFAIWNPSGVAGKEASPIGLGSHLDTQPMGGRFDGILGVLSGLEVVRTLKEKGVATTQPLAVIDWTNEEGARFPVMCSGSGVWAGTKTLDSLHALESLTEGGVTMGSELERLGFLGQTKCSYKENKLAAHFELHIEQAKRLEQTEKRVGVVTGVQGMRWYEVVIQGKEGHAGSTPMADRKDALVAASKIVLEVEKEAKRINGFGTVGFLKTRSEAPNTIVGEVKLTIDLRHPEEKTLDEVQHNLQRFLDQLESETKALRTNMKQTWGSEAVSFDNDALDCVRQAAANVAGQGSCMEMYSCAGHDSAETARVVPTAMIFVPSKDGISHNPAEWTSQEQCADGAQTLLEAVLAYDKLHPFER